MTDLTDIAPTATSDTILTSAAADSPYRVHPGQPIRLADIDPNTVDEDLSKKDAKKQLGKLGKRIAEAQNRLYAENRQSLLVIFQATDTGGKSGTIRRVFQGVNPQGCRVWSFGKPSAEELDHDFLWRIHAHTPGRGMIGVFDRSHYEDVLVVRVKELMPEAVWRARYGAINDFERLLALSNTTILKFYLHISRDEQKRRLDSRLERAEKHWKFNPDDLSDRDLWADYQAAYEDAINRCTTDYAPWYIIPANHKWYRNVVVASIIADTLDRMNPDYPPPADNLDGITVPE
jgi:PPK2 family polyphosphate:nucleotide phosphotransferase